MARSLRLLLGVPLVWLGGAQARAGDVSAWSAASIPMLQECPAQGVKITETDTCIRFGGQLRAESTVGAASRKGGTPQNFRRGLTSMRAEGKLSVDVRTPTELGPIRAYASVRSPASGAALFGR